MAPNTITTSDKAVLSHHGFADIMQNSISNQKSLHATVSFVAGAVLSQFKAGITQSYATYLTVQTGVDTHITLMPEFLQYINHSCEPNVFFNTEAMELVALKDIQPGDEFTFFYPSTEWEMAQPFVCSCGTKDCLQLINGASNLTIQTLSRYKLTDFIKQQVKQKLSL